MKLGLLTTALPIVAIGILGGISITRLRFKRWERGKIASRLSPWLVREPIPVSPVTLLKRPERLAVEPAIQFFIGLPGMEFLNILLGQAGLAKHFSTFVIVSLSLLLLPLFVALMVGFNLLIASCLSIFLASLPIIILRLKAEAMRVKFCEQLPDGIDLMVAVLRSGHSIAQSVKAVSLEIPAPCGEEFETILYRMNLGQPLSEALTLSARRFRSYELDLMQRAVGIQAEVGGSLAELLDKTNYSLRQRLKLSQQLKVITAQSRLSAGIVGLLPIGLAVGLNFINPGYVQVLIEDKIGQNLACLAILLELIGIYVMRRMSIIRM